MNSGKKVFIMLLAAVAAVITFLSACTADLTENVSEIRRGYFSAEDDVMTVTVVSGMRERNYVADGVAGELVPYTLVTVVPKTFDPDATYTYAVSANGASYGGTMKVHPFAASFSAEVEAELTGEITVTVNDREYAPVDMTGDGVSFDKAIDAAKTELKPEDGYEVRARMIKNPIGDGLCWHVAYYFRSGKQSGVLLDPIDLNTLAKKTD